MKFCFIMKKNLFPFLFIADKMNYNFVSGVVRVNDPIKICKQTRARHRDKHVGDNSSFIY